MKLLIIEDNKHLAQQIKQLLCPQYTVDLAYTGDEGLTLAQQELYGVIILDLGLPTKDGLTVCCELRSSGIASSVLILTAHNKLEQKVKLLECGADDYLTKPFKAQELKARVDALARRSFRQLTQQKVLLHDLVIYTASRKVERSGVPIQLRRKEFDILEYLVQNKGRPVTREMILRNVWEADTESWNNTVDVHIKYLRDKIDRPFESGLIKTAHGIGYMIDA